jgi:hypothetical protein
VTREEIVERMGWFKSADNVMSDIIVRIEKIVNAAIAAEREECAKVCEETTAAWTQYLYNEGCIDCAKAIRARGET